MLATAAAVTLPTARAADAAAEIAFERHPIGRATVSLPTRRANLTEPSPIWLHLHGAPAVLETNFAAMGAPGVLVHLSLPGLSKVYADYFTDPEAFRQLLRATEAVLRRRTQSNGLGRVTVSAFSAGFGGVRELLRQPEALERIDVLVMADSIYCGYAGDIAARQVDEELMAGFARFAQLAGKGEKTFLVSHSRQVPIGYASTTETADYLIARLEGERRPAARSRWPGGLVLRTEFSAGRFQVLGFDGDGADDHMRHLREIGSLWRRALAAP